MKGIWVLVLFTCMSNAFAAVWPNDPPGSTLLTDWNFTTLTGNGWFDAYPGSSVIVSDPTTPGSPNNVVQMTYHKGMIGGIGPGNINYPLPANTFELYAGYWWKPSNPWQGHIAGNKISFFLGNGNAGSIILFMAGPPTGPFTLSIYYPTVGVSNGHLPNSYGDDPGTRHLNGNVSNPTIELGKWHRLELYTKHSTTGTSKDGIIRWWLDGTLVGNHINVNFVRSPFAEFQFAPTWGGTGDVKTQTDYFWFDDVRLSRPNGAPSIFMISTMSLSGGRTGVAYSRTLAAEGGKTPYAWTVSSGSLPPGLSLNKTTGTISGTPTIPGRSDFTVKAMDSSIPARETSRPYTIVVSGTSALSGETGITAASRTLAIRTKAGQALIGLPLRAQANYDLRIFNLSGKAVYACNSTTSGSQNVVVPALKSGLYFAKIVQGGKSNTIRFNVLD